MACATGTLGLVGVAPGPQIMRWRCKRPFHGAKRPTSKPEKKRYEPPPTPPPDATGCVRLVCGMLPLNTAERFERSLAGFEAKNASPRPAIAIFQRLQHAVSDSLLAGGLEQAGLMVLG